MELTTRMIPLIQAARLTCRPAKMRGPSNSASVSLLAGRILRDHRATERRVDQNLRAVALLVGVVKELRDHEALLVRDVDAGIGNSGKEPAVFRRLLVQDAVAANRLRIDVGEQAIRDVLFGFELAQEGLIVIGDRVDLDTLFLKLRERIAQLAELRPARGSPHRRAIEDHDRLRVAAALVKIDPLAVRVG